MVLGIGESFERGGVVGTYEFLDICILWESVWEMVV